uniref:Protein kinase domain-containing protein n=1 Tax=Mesocestoides corti TaxID=53468 RepID=A0A5K3EU11_MESCO
MICNEEYISTALDIPVCYAQNELVISSADDVVSYEYSEDGHLWLKTIKLEKCNRSELGGVLTFLKNLQSISPYRILSDSSDRTLKTTVYHGCHLPLYISLDGTDLRLSYPICKSGCVQELLKPYFADGGLPENLVAAIFSRAVKSVCELHKAGWIHRALCSRHLLLNQLAQDKDSLDVSLCGLGSIAHVKPNGSCLNRTGLPVIDAGWRGWHYQNLLDTVYSTHPVAWYSPEMIAQDFQGYGEPSDIYSLGLTLGEMFTGIPPFVGTITPSLIFLKKLTLKEPLSLPSPPNTTASAEMVSVFKQCTHFDPDRRPTADELLQLPWIQKGLSTPLTEAMLEPFRR